MTGIKFKMDNETLYFDEFLMLTLVAENKSLLFDYLSYLNNGFLGKEKYWTLFDDNNPIDIDDYAEFIPNIFHLEINSKKNINALYKIIRNNYSDLFETKLDEIKEISKEIINLVSEDFDIELNSESTISSDDIFKIYNLKFNEDNLTVKDSLLKFIFVVNKLRGIKIFFINNLHLYFEKSELELFIKEISYRNIRIVNFECSNNHILLENEKLFLIDNDLCFIK